MVEVTNTNYNDVLKDFEHLINKCTFFAVDCEFTILPNDSFKDDGFLESPKERYSKIKQHIDKSLIIQIGITPFRYYRDLNHYKAFPHNFYVFPQSFGPINASLASTASTIHFLCDSKMDFNKVFYDGIPYMNKTCLETILKELKKGTLLTSVEQNLDFNYIDEIVLICDKIKNWITSSQEDCYELPCKKLNPAFNFALKEEILKLSNNITVSDKDHKFTVTKIKPGEKSASETSESINTFIDSIEGFSKIYKILSSSKKPMVGHNFLIDILTMYHHFHDDLPDSYSDFKESIHNLFPHVYDTKQIVLDLKHLKNPKGGPMKSSLLEVYESYQDTGNNFYFPQIMMGQKGIYDSVDAQHPHDAGWDSYMTGFIFLKMADEYVRTKKNNSHLTSVTSSQLFGQMEEWRNKIRIIRSRLSHINLGDEDPESSRPPLLHVSHLSKKCLRTVELDALFKKYEPLSKRQLDAHSALIATPSYKSFKKILVDFSTSNELRVEKYSLIKHNKCVQACLIPGSVEDS